MAYVNKVYIINWYTLSIVLTFKFKAVVSNGISQMPNNLLDCFKFI